MISPFTSMLPPIQIWTLELKNIWPHEVLFVLILAVFSLTTMWEVGSMAERFKHRCLLRDYGGFVFWLGIPMKPQNTETADHIYLDILTVKS